MVEGGRRQRLRRGHRGRWHAHDGGRDVGGSRPLECPPAGDELVQQRAEREDVGPVIGGRPLTCSGAMYCGVPRNAPTRVGVDGNSGAIGFRTVDDQLGETKVEQLCARLRQHDVARLDVTVYDALTVRVVERLCDLDGDGQCLWHWHGATLQAPGERLTLQALHHDEGRAVVLADVVHRADVRARHL